MASLQASWFSSFNAINSPTNVKKSQSFKPFRVSFSLNSFNGETSQPVSPNSPNTSSEAESGPVDPVKLAFAKAKEYKKMVRESPKMKIEQNPVDDSESGSKEVADSVKVLMEKAKEYKKERDKLSSGLEEKSWESSCTGTVEEKGEKKKELSVSSIDFMGLNFAEKKKGRGLPPGLVLVSDPFPEGDIPEVEIILGDTSKFKNGKKGSVSDGSSGEAKEVTDPVKIALEKAKEYKKNKGVADTDGGTSRGESSEISALNEPSEGNFDSGTVEKKADKKGKLLISSVDFMGLNFADKKQGRGLPPGLLPVSDRFPEGDIPEVEIIVGDTSKFTDAAKSSTPDRDQETDLDVYKPKVSTWGVFPRPSNISKTFGGGRNLKPGEALETAEEKAAKEARTRNLIAEYKRKIGMNIDAKLKSECEEALDKGDLLMNLGKLKEALPHYQKVMDKLPFQSELHGLAALQWSICQDSLGRTEALFAIPKDVLMVDRPNEARVMYERLQSHPNAKVSKKARQFMFSFQAMEMMKVTTSSPSSMKNTGYQNYFEAFVENKANYPLKEVEDEEIGSFSQTLPYIFLLLSPIFLVLLIAVQKRI